MFRIVICDDKKENIAFLNSRIRKAISDMRGGRNTEVLSAKPELLYEYTINDNYVYIFFLDVIYDKINGIDIAGRLRRQHRNIYIIFYTEHIELLYMVINQNLMPSGFLAKPVNDNDLKKILFTVYDYCIDDIKDETATLIVSTGSAVYKIRYDEIIYIEALNKKIYIYTETQRICFYDSLQNLCERLGKDFLRCHKSFVVNKEKIKNVYTKEMYLEMSNGSRIAMSRTYKSEIKDNMKRGII
ncbi:MAG: LytR/AlgR family response regulator transcription factor [Lachnospirales bacterium]